jgi:CheY-like chemotaxis protein
VVTDITTKVDELLGEGRTPDGRKDLLSDDDVDFLELDKAALETIGYQVVLSHGMKEARDVIRRPTIGAAVLDVIASAPEDGFYLPRALRKDERTKNVPLLMLTSVNAVYGAKGFLFKLSDRDRDEPWLPVDRFLDKQIKRELPE